MRVLVVNAGSSSLKVDLIDDGQWAGSFDGLPETAPHVDAVGHRIVHGGPDLVEPVVIDTAVEKQLRDLVQLAPLHQPKSLDGLDAARRLLPDLPHVACFDTAFHGKPPGRQLPPRRRRLPDRRAGRAQRRHQDGLRPAGRVGHGHP
jgi:acetate kinase